MFIDRIYDGLINTQVICTRLLKKCFGIVHELVKNKKKNIENVFSFTSLNKADKKECLKNNKPGIKKIMICIINNYDK